MEWLSDWEKEVKARKDLTANEKKKLILSRETLFGIRITSKVVIIVKRKIICNQSAYSFIELVQYLLTVPGVKSFLSEKISNPLEKYFGQHCQRGRTNENPSSTQFLKNQQALRVVNSIRIHGLIKGNTQGNKEPTQIPTESQTLPKRKRTSTSSTIHTTPASS